MPEYSFRPIFQFLTKLAHYERRTPLGYQYFNPRLEFNSLSHYAFETGQMESSTCIAEVFLLLNWPVSNPSKTKNIHYERGVTVVWV